MKTDKDNTKRLVARKGAMDLVTTKGDVYLYAGVVELGATYVCSLGDFRAGAHKLAAEGWEIFL